MESHAPTPVRSLPALLTVDEAATVARTSASTIRFWIATNRLASLKPGRRRLIRRQDLAALLGCSADELSR
jgi:excisionase family DNA binding protein